MNKIVYIAAVILTLYISCSDATGSVVDRHYIILTNDAELKPLCEKLTRLTGDYSDARIFISEDEVKKYNNVKKIELKIDLRLPSDIEFKVGPDSFKIIGNKEKSIQWMFWQLVRGLSNSDNRINLSAEIPNVVPIDASMKFNFAFNYREPYFEPNLRKGATELLGTHNVEEEWGIWGHNLGKLLNKNPNEECQSFHDGKRNESQICFSSDGTQKFVEEHILDQFGHSADYPVKFMIAPNDNAIVCQCDRCKKCGNTPTNVSPALFQFVKKLATKFKHHEFFALDYLTLNGYEGDELPENVGIFISTVSLAKSADFRTKLETKQFEAKVAKWKSEVPKVYVWDYLSNFDDYLTPFPNLLILQEQIKFYQEIGISGIFGNGSGYDKSAFDGLKTHTYSALLADPKVDVKSIVEDYLLSRSPKMGQEIFDFYWKLELAANNSNKNPVLNMYGGIAEMENLYLNREDFLRFYSALETSTSSLKGIELKFVEDLLESLSFTYIQLALSSGLDGGFARITENREIILDKHFLKVVEYLNSRMTNQKNRVYKENGGEISAYLEGLNGLLQSIDSDEESLLFGKKLKSYTPLDDSYIDTKMLTDGIFGISSDYHTNWFFNSHGRLELELPEIRLDKTFTVQISFIDDQGLGLELPARVVVKTNGYSICVLEPTSRKANKVTFSKDVTLASSNRYTLEIVADQKKKKFACDEIQIY